jgi:hypothetical protein
MLRHPVTALLLVVTIAGPTGAGKPKGKVVYIFGYGSLINPDSRARTGLSGEAIPVEVTGLERRWNFVRRKLSDKTLKNLEEQNKNLPDAKKVPPEVLKELRKLIGREFRSQKEWLNTLAKRRVMLADFADPLFRAAAVGVTEKDGAVTNGVVVAVPETEIGAFDRREDGYTRIPLRKLKGRPRVTPLYGKRLPEVASGAVEVYVPDLPCAPRADAPIIQSYVDVLLAGAILQFGEGYARRLVQTTKGWEYDWVDDRHRPVYSRLRPHGGLAKRIDALLADNLPKALPEGKKATRVFRSP